MVKNHTKKVALIIPCFNEAASIGDVITDFKLALPSIFIHVFDNNSSDETASIAANLGASVTHVTSKGKGNVVRRMFSEVNADIYVMVDGDGTYDSKSLALMIDLLDKNKLDMVVGVRKVAERATTKAYRSGHQLGNRLLTKSVYFIFGAGFTDMLSGYRVFSNRFVKTFPALSSGFEIETELTVHALQLRLPCGEVETPYGVRREGSESKLSTYKDGLLILIMIIKLFILERPLLFFFIVGFLQLLVGFLLGFPIIIDFLETGLVLRLPTALLSASLVILAMLSFVCGLILSNVVAGRIEAKRMAYLNIGMKV